MINYKVSVVIPVFNGEKSLEACLRSVLCQTYSNYEIIVVDNNSSDKTSSIIKKFKRNNKNIKYVFEIEKTRGAARNAGINAAGGIIIAMTDADCVVPRNWIEEITRPLIFENENIVIGAELDLTGNYWTKHIQKSNRKFLDYSNSCKYIDHIDTKNFAIKTEIMQQLMFDPRIGNLEDFELYLRVKGLLKIRFLPYLKVGHYHKNTFFRVVCLQFDRGFWISKIYKKHMDMININEECMLESLTIKNFLMFPFWLIYQFIKNPISDAAFLFITETCWRAGILWYIIRQ